MSEVNLHRVLVFGLTLIVLCLLSALAPPSAYGLEKLWSNFGGMFISLGAFVFAYMLALYAARTTMEMQRRTKLSEFRQNWINGLRDDVSNLIAVCGTRPPTIESTRERNALIARCMLRLNPNEDFHEEFRKATNKLVFGSQLDQEIKEFVEASNELSNIVQAYLKAEWDELKKELAGKK